MREQDQMLFDRACEITASAVRGQMGEKDSQPASFVGDVFREIHKALIEVAQEMPEARKAGF